MALSDGLALFQLGNTIEERLQLRRLVLEQAEQAEKARASERRCFKDSQGVSWQYVVLDGGSIRIEACESLPPVVHIPSFIEDKPVVALADDACAYKPELESVYCPDTLISIGFCAFRECRKLSSIFFPPYVTKFDSHWLRNCTSLRQLRLPGQLTRIDSSIFDLEALRVLEIGAGTSQIVPGAFSKSKLERVVVDETNPYLMSDGYALYSRENDLLVALAIPQKTYQVLDGCRKIAKKGFSNYSELEEIIFPESLEVLGEFACANTAITEFRAPVSLRYISQKAFYNCSHLSRVSLDCEVREVGQHAFSGTQIQSLHLPATVESIAYPLAAGAPLCYTGSDASFTIDKTSPFLLLDEQGGLYQKCSEGLIFLRMMNPHITTYHFHEQTIEVADEAFFSHASLEEACLSEGVKKIGSRAFKACRNLWRMQLPNSIVSIGEEAFLDTELQQIHLPDSLEYLGLNALISYGAHHGSNPSLHAVELNKCNARFYLDGSLLLEHKSTKSSRVLLCLGTSDEITIPPEVNEIAPYAFNGVKGIQKLHLSDKIETVGIRGLAVDGLVPFITVDLQQAYQGHRSFTLNFPDTDRSAQQQMLALSVPDHVDPAVLFEHYDSAIVNASSFDPLNVARLELYEQTLRILERLKDPVFLTQVNRSLCERVLKINIEAICKELAKRDDRNSLDDLMDLGFIHADNINEIIGSVASVQDASLTGYLFEAKRTRFGGSAFDFDL